MYKIEYLPSASQDMVDIVVYIALNLANPSAAEKLTVKFEKACEKLAEFPYAYHVYTPVKPLKHEYRQVVVNKYNMFYWVDEGRKKVVIARVIYGKRDFSKIFKEVQSRKNNQRV